ncbi:MAG TPA: DUF3501 family protein [Steroidobacteraceae bacterium]|nr:DUF3501 family protein [Steroidobacteraceae bacterium]
MQPLTRDDLLSLEQYARERSAWRERIIAHKKPRTLQVGPNTTWCFEDRATIHYQVQEMLRAERTFEQGGIEEELGAYNPLIPDGSNWKVTFMIEYPDPTERAAALSRLKGVEDRCWVAVGRLPRVYAIADEDLERENAEKTSAVHFLRFELTGEMKSELRKGAVLALGIDHPAYSHALEPVPEASAASLLADLD